MRVIGCRVSFKTVTVSGLVLAALAGLAARALHYAALPPFTPTATLSEGPRIELRGVALTRDTARGRLEVRVARIRPGHQRVGYFMLGPSTHLALEQVSVRCHADPARPTAPTWSARGRRARLQGESLVFLSRCTWNEPPVPPRRRSDVRIDLGTGAVTRSW